MVVLKSTVKRDQSARLPFRVGAALLGLPSLWAACSFLYRYLYAQSRAHDLWTIAGLCLYSLFWLWPATTGFLFPQWRSSRAP
jgi:hypothetical protein